MKISSINLEGKPLMIIWPFNRIRTIGSVEKAFKDSAEIGKRVMNNEDIQSRFEI